MGGACGTGTGLPDGPREKEVIRKEELSRTHRCLTLASGQSQLLG
jgi:hypothetical protein